MHSTSKTLSQTLSKTLSAHRVHIVHCVHAVHSRLPTTTSHDTSYRTASCKNPAPKWEKPGNPIATQQLLLGKQVGILWERLGNSREKPGNWCTARSPRKSSAISKFQPKTLGHFKHFKDNPQKPPPFQHKRPCIFTSPGVQSSGSSSSRPKMEMLAEPNFVKERRFRLACPVQHRLLATRGAFRIIRSLFGI
jgi:hypothetical protein